MGKQSADTWGIAHLNKKSYFHLFVIMYICPPFCGKVIEFRGVAQLVAHLVWDQRVAGSNPVAPTNLLAPVIRGFLFHFVRNTSSSGFRISNPRIVKVCSKFGKIALICFSDFLLSCKTMMSPLFTCSVIFFKTL